MVLIYSSKRRLISLLLIGLLLCDVSSVVVLTKALRQEMLDAHNKFRRMTTAASNMRLMRWDCELEKFAMEWLKNCKFEHSPKPSRKNEKRFGFRYIGENLLIEWNTRVIDLPINMTKAIQGWYDEIKDFTYPDNCKPGEVCGHYTQMVWAESYSLGCALTRCTDDIRDGMTSQAIVACNYGPGGNIAGESPYNRENDKCATCKKSGSIDWTVACVNGLCNDTPEPPALPQCSTAAEDGDSNDADAKDASIWVKVTCIVTAIAQLLSH